MVRVGGLKHAVRNADARTDPSGLTPAAQLRAVAERAHAMTAALYDVVLSDHLPNLAAHGIHVLGAEALDHVSRTGITAYFRDEVLPALTPLAIDSARPFPILASLTLNIAFRLAPAAEGDSPRLAVVQVPARLPRLVRVGGAGPNRFVLLDEVIRAEFQALFPGQTLLEAAAFRLTRDAELELDEDQSYLDALEQGLRKRRRSAVVRLEIERRASDEFTDWMATLVGVERDDVYRLPAPLDLRALTALVDLPGFADLRYQSFQQAEVLPPSDASDIFSVLDERDLLLHHPYDSFDTVVDFIEAAADDSDVLAIKQTLYRTGGDSPIVAALTRAADQGKQVTVLLELMARFDEQRNIRWARRLEEMGAHVIYGIRHYKVHGKIALVVRRGRSGLKRYVHLGTGNYNDATARLYTDFGLMTADPDVGADASAIFTALSGYSDPPRLRKLVMAPTAMRGQLIKLVEREIRRAQTGQHAEIRAKMNSLVDPEIVLALYVASRAGVVVRLNVRGMCTLRPGVEGLSETITVVSVVGRFLEHHRILVLPHGGDQEDYVSSADWRPRNLDKRIERMFPVESPPCGRRVLEALEAMFRDTVKGRRLMPSGKWRVPPRAAGTERFDAQTYLREQARREAGEPVGTMFEPLGNPPT